jgi:hypothetical protein
MSAANMGMRLVCCCEQVNIGPSLRRSAIGRLSTEPKMDYGGLAAKGTVLLEALAVQCRLSPASSNFR